MAMSSSAGAARRLMMAAMAMGLSAGVALGQDTGQEIKDAPEPPASTIEGGKDRWVLDARPGVWFASPAGKLRMPAAPSLGRGQELELDDLNLDSPRLAPYAEVDLRRGNWGIGVGAFAFSASDRGFMPETTERLGDLVLTPGERVESSLDFASLAITGSYRFYEYRNRREQGGWNLDSSLDAVFGARMYDVDFEFTSVAGREQTDEFFIEPVVGVKWKIDIGEPFTISVRANGGVGPWGDRSSWSFDIAPTFEWRPVTHVGVEVGYRLLVTDLSSGDGAEEFSWRGSMAGVMFAVTLRF